jgi:hypothetical protein
MVDDVEALNLVCECRELEERYRSDFTAQTLETTDHLLREIYHAEGSNLVTNQSVKVSEHPKNHHGNWLEKAMGPSHRPRHTHCQEHKELDVHYVLNTEEYIL